MLDKPHSALEHFLVESVCLGFFLRIHRTKSLEKEEYERLGFRNDIQKGGYGCDEPERGQDREV